MTATTPIAEMPRAWSPLDEVATILGISRTSVYERVRSGAIPGRKVGGSWFVPIWWIDELVEAGTHGPAAA